jgi:hypothetical protein
MDTVELIKRINHELIDRSIDHNAAMQGHLTSLATGVPCSAEGVPGLLMVVVVRVRKPGVGPSGICASRFENVRTKELNYNNCRFTCLSKTLKHWPEYTYLNGLSRCVRM